MYESLALPDSTILDKRRKAVLSGKKTPLKNGIFQY
jgi:hypothetical protein